MSNPFSRLDLRTPCLSTLLSFYYLVNASVNPDILGVKGILFPLFVSSSSRKSTAGG